MQSPRVHVKLQWDDGSEEPKYDTPQRAQSQQHNKAKINQIEQPLKMQSQYM
jgi:hypothetical protein